ncbi:hypothetical protein HA402_009311 [Bradysia odoriphaga]|nr:hypothetical protein HA402_009311 [Bradysia odoriphaga]
MKRASIRSSKRSGGKKKSLTDTTIIRPADDGRVLIQKEESATGSIMGSDLFHVLLDLIDFGIKTISNFSKSSIG